MIKAMIDDHLTSLCQNFLQYFPNIIQIEKQLDWGRDPFSVPEGNLAALPLNLQEILLEVSTDRGSQLRLSGVLLTESWTFVKQEHPDLEMRLWNTCYLLHPLIYAKLRFQQ